MRILVCFKVLPNPDRILEEDWETFSPSDPYSYAGMDFNCFDGSALELGLRIKEQAAVQGVEAVCTALTVSATLPASLASNLYAAGFDEVLCLPRKQREFAPEQIARLLADTAKEQAADLIITGVQAGMAETGMVPFYMAEQLQYPMAANAETASWQDGTLCVQCRQPEGLVEKKISLPALFTVGNSPQVLRCATLRARMQCRDKKAILLPAQEETLQEEPKLTHPHTGRSCVMLDPGDADSIDRILSELQKATAGQGESAEAQASHAAWDTILQHSAIWVEPGTLYDAKNLVLKAEEKQQMSGLVLLPDTAASRMLAVHLAQQMQRECFFDATLTDLTKTAVTVKKRVCAANLEWEKTLKLPAVLTISPQEQQRFSAVPRIRLAAQTQPSWLKQETMISPAEPGSLQNASLVLICGCGIGSAAATEKVRALAQRLGAGFGLTRPAALNLWGSTTEIVGQSGSILAPQCCLVLGAAGAGAFAVGIEHAKTVIAVNTDAEALIFKNADLGIRMDARTLVDRLIERLS